MSKQENPIISSDINATIDKIVGFHVEIGDRFIDADGNRLIVKGFECDERYNKPFYYIVLDHINSQFYDGIRTTRIEAKDFNSDTNRSSLVKVEVTFEELDRAALDMITNGLPEEAQSQSDTKALSFSSPASRIASTKEELVKRNALVESMRRTILARMRGIAAITQTLRRQIKYTSRVLQVLETFIGEYENILQIREGEAAGIHEPITIRQLVLYADEEIGDISFGENGQIGLDFNRLDEIDAWLAAARNFELFTPEQKCVVAIKISRQYRDYDANRVVNIMMNSNNAATYLLIRNGEKLYRLWTENLDIGTCLIPSQGEWEKLSEQMSRENISEDQQIDLKDKEMTLALPGVLIQGLITRSDVFQPLPYEVNVFDPTSFEEGLIRIIYDAEGRLSDGHLPFAQWRQELNGKLKRGNRIYFNGLGWMEDKMKAYYFRSYRNWYPSFPEAGVYTVEDIEESTYNGRPDGFYIKILYLPSDETYSYENGYQPRERRVAFYFRPSDSSILNYDDVTLEDAQFYISNRLERGNYLKVLPILYHMRTVRQQERQHEQHLVELIANEFRCEKQIVWDAVEWWKKKVINHRAIASDDQKAWRMIRRQIAAVLDGKAQPE